MKDEVIREVGIWSEDRGKGRNHARVSDVGMINRMKNV